MTHRPRITEESVFTRWMGLEIAKINDGIVAERKPLAALLTEESPRARTRGGGEYHFDPKVLAALGERLPADLSASLKLPILFVFDMDVPDSCYLTDGTAVLALQALGDLGAGRRLSGGKVWVSRAIAFAINRKYPAFVQFLMS
ncbi:MAG TPA: DUF61 family protein [Methanomicrobiales archaeon]|nr:DUF61 family protein [Methanomicrobiales archaeon]